MTRIKRPALGIVTAYRPMCTLGFFLSLLLHASVIYLGFTWTGMFQPALSLDVPVYNVDLVTLAPPAPPAPAPPKPAPKEVAPPAKPEPKPIPPAPKPVPKPKPKDISPKKVQAPPAKKKQIIKKKPEPTPEQIMAQALKQAKNKAVAQEKRERRELDKQIEALRKQAEAAGAVGTGPGGNATGQGVPGLVAVYGQIVEQAIKKNWRYPVMGHEQNISAVVEIDVAPDGTITDSRLLATSGKPEFDASAMRAVAETKVLPAPPQTMVDKISITFNLQELNR